MIGTRFDYLLTVAVLLAFITAAYGDELRVAARRVPFWYAAITYLICCAILDFLALDLCWWSFNNSKICGITIAHIPIEEFVLFAAIYSLSVAAWTRLP